MDLYKKLYYLFKIDFLLCFNFLIMDTPRYRTNRHGERIRLCNYQSRQGFGYICNDIVCIESEFFCRTHHNQHQNRMRRRREMEEYQLINRLTNSPVLHRIRSLANLNLNIERENIVFNFERDNLEDLVRSNKIFENECKKCVVCEKDIETSLVKLECECHYHLNCYLPNHKEEKCVKCGDKINKTEEEMSKCSICLDTIKEGRVKTKCGHTFHRDCINSWIQIGRGNNTDKCPMCRQNMN